MSSSQQSDDQSALHATPSLKAFSPTKLAGLELPNRIIKAATFEGRCENGFAKDSLIDFHQKIVEGGTGMTTVAYCAVEPDGRVMDQMMWMHERARPQLEKLATAVHRSGGKLSGQMVHCGNFSQNASFRGKRPLGPSKMLNLGGLPFGLLFAGEMSERDINARVQQFHDAAQFMKSCGFDAVEVHVGHGYGLSQFISPKTNKRTDHYGGSLINRMRFPLKCIEAVRRAVGEDFPILVKMGLTDGVKGGLKIDEAIEVAALLDEAGVDCIIPSGGTSSFNPMLLFRGESLAKGMIENETNWLMRLGLKIIGPSLFKEYPYEELYFLDGARRVRDRVSRAKVCYIGGCSDRASLEQVMNEFDFVQLGRALIKDPNMVKNLQADPHYKNGCTHCNRCAAMIKHPDGVHCVLEPNT
jgi:2,4-dienoyl-CoA reductase-like NADH-dependent reductase (Old Yellow Enzyme family)